MHRTYIIAEAGVNHNGDINLAKKMIVEAKNSGADAIKFQTFISENLVTAQAPKAEYQKAVTGKEESQLKMLKKLELSFEQFRILKFYAQEVGVDFLSTPFDLESIDFLSSISVPVWKIPSGEITNLPYLRKLSNTGLPIILSTGMSTMEEIRAAIEVFSDYSSTDITLLHCNTEYPTPFSNVNLKAMITMRDAFGVRVGYSDHTLGIEVPIAAVAMGASVIEKHFTLSRHLEGPDHKASLEPGQLQEMVRCIRNVEIAFGDGIKRPSSSEIKNAAVARKSIVAKKDIKQGERFTEYNITTKRPGDGLSPMKWDEVIGKLAIKDYKKDENINL